MDIKEIQNLIKFVAKSGASEVKLEIKDVKITIKTGSGTTETTIVQAAPMQGMPQDGSTNNCHSSSAAICTSCTLKILNTLLSSLQ